jgi:hypothetical protein
VHIIVLSGCIAWVLLVLALLSIAAVASRAERITEGWDKWGPKPAPIRALDPTDRRFRA